MANAISRERAWLCLVALGMLTPFVGKAFHIDDPIFLWTAEQIAVNPFDFLGFDVNWYGYLQPMSEINKNPPLASFYLAGVAAIGGWSEVSLHLGMLIPSLALVAGMHLLALRFTRTGWLAVLVAIATPVFLVSATSLMSDVPMLALWVWTAVVFLAALDSNKKLHFALAGVLMTCCVLTKYFGLAVVPLLGAYALMREQKLGTWTISFGIAFVGITAFCLYTQSLYGFNPLLDVMGYVRNPDNTSSHSFLQRGAIGLLFLGGCNLGTLFFAPWLWSWRGHLVGLCGMGIMICGILYLSGPMGSTPSLWFQHMLFAIAGLHLLMLVGTDLFIARDRDSVFLALWLVGVFVFAAFANWTTNARSILPAIPAIGILIARGIERRHAGIPFYALPALGIALAITGVVAIADAQFADAGRRAARELSMTRINPGEKLYFQGSWGFQRYMELAGVSKLSVWDIQLKAGDMVVMAESTNVFPLPEKNSRLLRLHEYQKSAWVALMSLERDAGFYASMWGPLPFSFGRTPPTVYASYRMTRNWSPPRRKDGKPEEQESGRVN